MFTIMEKKNSIVPSIEEGKRRLSLYNSLKKDLAGVEHENRRQIVYELMDYVQRLETDQRMPLSIRLKYYYCAETIFRFLYENKQVRLTQVGVDEALFDQVEDVLLSIANEHDED